MILVTGATGMLGSHLLCELAKKKVAVRAMCRENSRMEQVRNVFRLYTDAPEEAFSRIEWVKGDMTDIYAVEEAMEGVQQVYHCAALMSFESRHHRQMLKVNSIGAANIVNAALQKGVGRLCHVSSIAALGRPENNSDTIDEKLLWKSSRNNSIYSISKYEAEREVWRGIAEGLEAVIVNPSIILGYAGVDSGSARLFTTAAKNLRFYPVGVNGFVDVRDVASAMVMLMECGLSNERFILNAENISYKRLFELMAATFGMPGPKYRVGPLPASLAWRAERLRSWITRRPPVLTRETARTSGNKHYYSAEKIKKTTGFQFRPIEETIKHHCQNYSGFNV